MEFRPQQTRSGVVLVGLAGLVGLGSLYLATILLQQGSAATTFLALIVFLLALFGSGSLLYLGITAQQLTYRLTRNGLLIRWGATQQLVPMRHIRDIIPGSLFQDSPGQEGLNLLGLRLGKGQLDGHGLLKIRATAPLAKSLLVVTPDHSYVISPQAPAEFVKAWQARQTLGPTQQWQEETRRLRPFDQPLLTDRLAWRLIGLSGLLLLLLLGYISLNYESIPQALPIHFDSFGRADRIAPKVFLFTLPAVGGIVWLINALLGGLIYQRERLGAYLLWGSTAAVQLSLWVALFTITGA